MSLTLPHGPLSRRPAAANFTIDGPAHFLYFEAFPRRVRGVFAGETVLDTRCGKLLHETRLLPQLYVPREDVRTDLLRATDHHTHCPFKGDASYFSMVIGERTAENAAWTYPEPEERARWLDEDEKVQGHLRDPYHRVDVRPTSRHVRVMVGIVIELDGERPPR